jgi:hypothetical protein
VFLEMLLRSVLFVCLFVCVCPPTFQLTQMTDFHETWYEDNGITRNGNGPLISFSRQEPCDAGATLAPLTSELRNDAR